MDSDHQASAIIDCSRDSGLQKLLDSNGKGCLGTVAFVNSVAKQCLCSLGTSIEHF